MPQPFLSMLNIPSTPSPSLPPALPLHVNALPSTQVPRGTSGGGHGHPPAPHTQGRPRALHQLQDSMRAGTVFACPPPNPHPGAWHSVGDLFFILKIYLFIYFWLRWVFIDVRGLSLVAARGGYSSLWRAGFSLRWLLLLQSMGSRCAGFSSCGTWAQ